jgi:hypothetical protein
MEELTLLQTIEWCEDPIQICAGQPIIPASKFEELANEMVAYPEVLRSAEEIVAILKDQTKRFSACGANQADRFGVIRKNKVNGWQYIVDLVII